MDSNLKGRSGIPTFLTHTARSLARRLAVHENVDYGYALRVGRGSVISSPHGLRIGDYVSIGPRSIVQVDGEIGDFALIGMAVQIVGRNDHAIHELGRPIVDSTWIGDRAPDPRDTVLIGSDVWIGGASVVLSGITVGSGTIIGSGSVVSRSLPPCVIAVGNPARPIGDRFAHPGEAERHLEEISALAEQRRVQRQEGTERAR